MQPLPDRFMFSQSALRDWLRCQRLFQYRDVQRLAYPAPETADMLAYERFRAQGEAFHTLVHQYLSGVDVDLLTTRVTDETLANWWQAFLTHGLKDIPERRYAETVLTGTVGGYRMLAKYDLIAVAPDTRRLLIVDWKTTTREPQHDQLARNIQTTVYRYLAVKAGAYYLDWAPLEPEQVEMVYWFANFPTQPVRLTYNADQLATDEAWLTDLVATTAAETAFPKVPENQRERVCQYCVYRTLCWDDVIAGPFNGIPLDEAEPEPSALDLNIDLDQIGEIEF